MKTIAQLKKIAQFAKEHGVVQIEFNTNGDVSRMLFVHKPEPTAIFDKTIFNKKEDEEDDLFYSVPKKPIYREKE